MEDIMESRYSIPNRATSHTKSETMATCTRPAPVYAWRGSRADRGNYIPNPELSLNGNHLQTWKLDFSKGVSLGKQLFLAVGSSPNSWWTIEKKLNWNFRVIFFLIIICQGFFSQSLHIYYIFKFCGLIGWLCANIFLCLLFLLFLYFCLFVVLSLSDWFFLFYFVIP